eukprot:s1486_g10.t1
MKCKVLGEEAQSSRLLLCEATRKALNCQMCTDGQERSLGSVNESAQQVAFADKVLLNKVDAAGPEQVAKVEDTIRRMNGICPMLRCSLSKRPNEIPLDELLSMESFSLEKVLEELQADVRLQADVSLCRPTKRPKHEHGDHGHGNGDHGQEDNGHGHGGDDHDEKKFRHDTGVGTCSFVFHKPLVLQRFTQVMNALRAERAVDLYRYKGVVCIKESSGLLRRAVLQGVHDMCEFEPRGDWTKTPTLSQLVFIGRKLDKEKWQKLFEKCQAGMRRCGLEATQPIPASLRAAALLSFEGEKVSFEEFLLWSQSTTFVEETLVRSPKERHLRQLARDHRCDFVQVEVLMKLFRACDTDGSGYIEWDEFRQVVCSMLKVKESTDISEARLQRYWKEADHQKTGRLDFEQFLVWYASNGTK